MLQGLNVTAQKLDASGPEAAGNVTVTAQNVLGVSFVAGGAGNITLTGNEINFKGEKNSVSGTGFLVLQPWSPGQNIAIGGSGDVGTNIYLNLTAKCRKFANWVCWNYYRSQQRYRFDSDCQ